MMHRPHLALAVTLALPLIAWSPDAPANGAKRRPASRAKGFYSNGSLQGGLALAAEGDHHYLLYPTRCYTHPRLAAHYSDPTRTENFYGHASVVTAVEQVAHEVRRQHPGAPRLPVGDLSNRAGGKIPFHLSHQNGLDVDIYFLQRAAANNPLATARHPIAPCYEGRRFERHHPTTGAWEVDPAFERQWNWTVAAAFAARRDVKVIFIGGLLKRELSRWAKANGVPRAERRRTLAKLHAVFCRAPKGVSIDSYRRNYCPHDDHFHVRFRCPAGSGTCREKRRPKKRPDKSEGNRSAPGRS